MQFRARRYHGQAPDDHISAGLYLDGREELTWGRDEDSGDPARSGEPVSSPIAAVRPRRALPALAEVPASEQRILRRVGIAYSLLFFNALTFYPGLSFLHIPSAVGKGLAQAALPLALIVALTIIARSSCARTCSCAWCPAGARSVPDDPAAPALRHRLPDVQAGRIRGRALAADPVVGQAGSAAGPLSSDGPRRYSSARCSSACWWLLPRPG